MEHPDPIEALYARAKSADVPMSAICDEAGVAHSTPSRWKNDKNGANLDTIRKLESALTCLIEARRQAA